ncbi:hypothetical protein SB822_53980 [Paraburkholderia sp. SIMBA_054]
MLPRLEQENARGLTRWKTCKSLPRDEPLWNLARSLAGLAPSADESRAVQFLRAFNYGEDAPARIAELLALGPRERVCILIDQFEELFAHARRFGPTEAQLFTQALVALHARPPEQLYVILTMRSEYLGACGLFDGFAEVVNDTQYLVPRMEHHDLARAIREPAALFGGEISPELTERLIADVGGSQDALPLIQHGLMVMYQRVAEARCDTEGSPGDQPEAGMRWRLSIEDFQSNGSLPDLLSRHADEVMARAVQAAQPLDNAPLAVENLFRTLTDIDADSRAIRRPRRLGRLALEAGCADHTDEVHKIIDVFRADGVSFLSPFGDGPIGENDLVDVSHEALIRCWKRLADQSGDWLGREFRDGLIWRALLIQAEAFEQNQSNVLGPTAVEERSRWIQTRNEYWAERYGGGWDKVQALLAASQVERERRINDEVAMRERDEAHRIELHKMKATRRLAIVIASGGFVTAVLASGLYMQYKTATDAQRKAEHEQLDAQRARSAEALAAQEALLAELRSANNTQQFQRDQDTAAKSLQYAQDEIGLVTKSTAIDEHPELKGRLLAAQDVLNKQASKLTDASADNAAPLLYIQIADNTQLPQVAELKRKLASYNFGGGPPDMPGAEVVKNVPTHSELRCFTNADCERYGQKLANAINASLVTPQVELRNLSARYGSYPNLRARQFELWFAKEPIVVKR